VSKGAVGLTAGYWPEDVYRYLAIPGISLEEGLITRTARRNPDHPALISHQGMVSYKQLSADIDQMMKAILSYSEGKAVRVAILLRQSIDCVTLLFGALRGRCTIFLTDPHLPLAALTTQMKQFVPDLIITDASSQQMDSLPQSVKVNQLQELQGKGANLTAPRGRLDLQAPAIALPMENGGLVYHSHKSLLAGAVSWSTFVPLKAEDLMLAIQPLHTWEGLYSLFSILFRGGACLVGDLDDPNQLAAMVQTHRPIYTILPRPEARKLYQSTHRSLVQAFRESLRGMFVSTDGPFTAIGRARLKRLLDKPALLTYGSAQSGAVLSSHPTWYLDAAVGMPLTNVDVWPLNPSTGNPLQVPWETVEFGEVGVKSPMTAVGYEAPEETEMHVREGWLRTKIVATMDPNGLFYIQSRVPD
jgi:long-chain acyl-CoA synthetase